MNKTTFTELFTAGDPDALFARIENECAGAADAQARIEALTKDHAALIADKDAAHEATIARMKNDSDTAAVQARDTADAALAQAAMDYAKAAEATKQIADDAIGALHDALSELQERLAAERKERDALATQLAARVEGQTALARECATRLAAAQTAISAIDNATANARAGLDAIADGITEALKPAEEKAASERQRLIAAKEAELAALKG